MDGLEWVVEIGYGEEDECCEGGKETDDFVRFSLNGGFSEFE